MTNQGNKARVAAAQANEDQRAEVLRRAGERTEWQILQEERERKRIAARLALLGYTPPVEPEPVDLDSL